MIGKKKQQDEPVKQNEQEEVQNSPEGQHEYFDMKQLSPIHETCVGEQFEAITIADFYANINLYPCKNKLKNQGKGKDTGVLPDIPDERETIQAIQG